MCIRDRLRYCSFLSNRTVRSTSATFHTFNKIIVQHVTLQTLLRNVTKHYEMLHPKVSILTVSKIIQDMNNDIVTESSVPYANRLHSENIQYICKLKMILYLYL